MGPGTASPVRLTSHAAEKPPSAIPPYPMNEHSGEGQSAGARDGLGVGHTSAFCLITGNFTMPLCNRIWRNKSFCDNGNNPSPTTFWAGHALLLPGGTFLRPRNGRAETAICPGEWPLPCPQPRSVRVQSVSMSSPRPQACPRLFRVASASTICPWTVRVRVLAISRVISQPPAATLPA